jgi:hypothetical protein
VVGTVGGLGRAGLLVGRSVVFRSRKNKNEKWRREESTSSLRLAQQSTELREWAQVKIAARRQNPKGRQHKTEFGRRRKGFEKSFGNCRIRLGRDGERRLRVGKGGEEKREGKM